MCFFSLDCRSDFIFGRRSLRGRGFYIHAKVDGKIVQCDVPPVQYTVAGDLFENLQFLRGSEGVL